MSTSYVLSRMRFKGRELLMRFWLILGMFPGFLSMICLYFLLKQFGLTQEGAVPGFIVTRTVTECHVRSKHIITPGSHKCNQRLINNNRLCQRNNHTKENLCSCCTVNSRRFVQCFWKRVKETFTDIISHTRTCNTN